jgi:hypothetical protein
MNVDGLGIAAVDGRDFGLAGEQACGSWASICRQSSIGAL